MGIYWELYDFAGSAGAFEGYVYKGSDRDFSYLPKWSRNLLAQYKRLPDEVRSEIQPLCNATLGRAVRSLVPVLGADHEVVATLEEMIEGPLPASPDDFDKH